MVCHRRCPRCDVVGESRGVCRAWITFESGRSNSAFPSVREPGVDAWSEPYSRGVWPRKKFLVLDGPSGMGKTECVRSLFGTEATLERNAACNDHAHLRDFDPFVHKTNLWDAASLRMVLAQRKLFQCPACWADLGGSPTERDVYRAWLNDCLRVIA